jgi:hypothetical protein
MKGSSSYHKIGMYLEVSLKARSTYDFCLLYSLD